MSSVRLSGWCLLVVCGLAIGGCLFTLHAQVRTLGTCANGTVSVTTPGGLVTCTPAVVTPPPVNCVGAWGGRVTVTTPACPASGQRTVTYRETFTVTTPASNGGAACVAAAGQTRQIDVIEPCTPPVTTPGGTIWGTVDADVLGDFTAAEHDVYTVDGGDGFRYRTWHPQCVSGRCYAHEHGDDPASQRDPWVREHFDPRMGYAARRMTSAAEPNGHNEAHDGYKVFVVNFGDINGEGRVNKTATTSMPHMGTGRAGRFALAHHSESLSENQGAYKVAFHLMADTGGVAAVCDPRAPAPTKDELMLGAPCKVDSPYAIWSMKAKVQQGGRVLLDQLITPAVFDPITVFNPANPTETVYAWDPRMAAGKNHPDDWSDHRGCSRESYSILPKVETQGQTTDVYQTDVMGTVVAGGPITVYLPRGLSGVPPNSSDIEQFKLRVDYCDGTEQWATAEGWRARAGVNGRVNKAKLGLKN